MPNQKTTSEEWKKEEWGGWKIVSEMLDNPNELGIYPTSECYKKLYNFVMEQKQKARKEAIEAVLPDSNNFFMKTCSQDIKIKAKEKLNIEIK